MKQAKHQFYRWEFQIYPKKCRLYYVMLLLQLEMTIIIITTILVRNPIRLPYTGTYVNKYAQKFHSPFLFKLSVKYDDSLFKIKILHIDSFQHHVSNCTYIAFISWLDISAIVWIRLMQCKYNFPTQHVRQLEYFEWNICNFWLDVYCLPSSISPLLLS